MAKNNVAEAVSLPAARYEEPPEGTIVLIRQSDGNWKGYTRKQGQVISERQYDPQIVLQLLMFHG